MERVAQLMDGWAAQLGLPDGERTRWRAAAWLHDALRDAPSAELRSILGGAADGIAGPLLHGPAAAAHLAADGVADPSFLLALRAHTTGHRDFDLLGRCLYLADHLESGRAFDPERGAVLRARLPRALTPVLVEVVANRIGHRLEHRRSVHVDTLAFWNRLVGEHGA